MAKFKPPKGKKGKSASDIKAGLPCLILLVSAFALMMFLFYAVLKSGS